MIIIISIASDKEPSVFGYQFKIVLSGSMEPDIKTGSMIMVKSVSDTKTFKKNDVITFLEEKDRLVTHRIVDVVDKDSGALYRTKGDNNDGVDINPVLSENVVAEYTGFTVPYLGYIAAFLQSHNGALLIILSGALLLFYSFYTIWRALANTDFVQKEEKEQEDGKKVLVD